MLLKHGVVLREHLSRAQRDRRNIRLFSQTLAPVLVFVSMCLAQVPSAPQLQADSVALEPAKQDDKWGYVDQAGKFIIPPQFEFAGRFSEGLAAVERDKRFGYIDRDAHLVIPPRYFGARPFKDGFAWVMTRKPWTPLGKGEFGSALFGQVTCIDHSGREVLPPFSAEHVSDFSEGLAAVRPGKISGGCSQKVGYLNTRGEWSIKPQFDEGRDFSEGLAAVNQGARCHGGGKWGYIDKDGTLIIPIQYDYAGRFKQGRACVEEAKEWKLIDTKGNATPIEKDKCRRWGQNH